MNRAITIIEISFLVGFLAAPAMAWGPHWGGEHRMMGYWGNDSENDVGNGTLTSGQETRLEILGHKFYDETKGLRAKIQTRYKERDTILAGINPDFEKARALQNDISDLRAKQDEMRLSYNMEARRILPDQRFGGWYGHVLMVDHGSMMGYRGGDCWNQF